MVGKGFVVVAVLAVGLAALQYRQHPGEPKDVLFEEIRPGVLRHLNDFPLLPAPFLPVSFPVPFHIRLVEILDRLLNLPPLQVPTATWLIQGANEHSWILIDAGPSTPSYQQSLKSALKAAIRGPNDELKLILLTHGHPDHVEVRH